MLVGFMGDTHGDTHRTIQGMARLRMAGADVVVQLGDFGYGWPGGKGKFENKVAAEAERMALPFYFLGGNHENWDALDMLITEHGWEKPIELSPNFYYLPNGCRFQLGSSGSKVNLGVLGGAWSIDWRYRTRYVSWWPQENLTAEEVERLGDDRLNVLLTHDGPEELEMFRGHSLPWRDEEEMNATRRLLRQAIRTTRPEALFHGHLHVRYSADFRYFPNPEASCTAKCNLYGLANADGDDLNDALALWQTNTRILQAHPLLKSERR